MTSLLNPEVSPLQVVTYLGVVGTLLLDAGAGAWVWMRQVTAVHLPAARLPLSGQVSVLQSVSGLIETTPRKTAQRGMMTCGADNGFARDGTVQIIARADVAEFLVRRIEDQTYVHQAPVLVN